MTVQNVINYSLASEDRTNGSRAWFPVGGHGKENTMINDVWNVNSAYSYFITAILFNEKSDVEEDAVQLAFTKLFFHLSDYKVKNESKFSAEAIKMMTIRQSLWSEEIIHFVIMALTNTVETFSEFPINIREAIVKHGWYERFGHKRVIIRHSRVVQQFYFIISGETMVVVVWNHKMSRETYGETVGKTVAFTKKGDIIGEITLMYGGERNVGVVYYDEVELLSVSSEDFAEIVMNLSTDTVPKLIGFIRNVPILDGLSIECLLYDDQRICLFTYFGRKIAQYLVSVTRECVYIVCISTCKVTKSMNEMIANGYKVDRYYGKIVCQYLTHDNTRQIIQIMFIELSSLHFGGNFSLESVTFEQLCSTTSVTFVSKVAKCVAIERKFFDDHVSESNMKYLRCKLQPSYDEHNLAIEFIDCGGTRLFNENRKLVWKTSIKLPVAVCAILLLGIFCLIFFRNCLFENLAYVYWICWKRRMVVSMPSVYPLTENSIL